MQGKGEQRLSDLQLLVVYSLCFGLCMRVCVCNSMFIEGKVLLFNSHSVCLCLCVDVSKPYTWTFLLCFLWVCIKACVAREWCLCVGPSLFTFFFPPHNLMPRVCLLQLYCMCVSVCVCVCSRIKGWGAVGGLRGPLTAAPAGGLSRWADPEKRGLAGGWWGTGLDGWEGGEVEVMGE